LRVQGRGDSSEREEEPQRLRHQRPAAQGRLSLTATRAAKGVKEDLAVQALKATGHLNHSNSSSFRDTTATLPNLNRSTTRAGTPTAAAAAAAPPLSQPDPSLSQQFPPGPSLESLTQPIGFSAAVDAAFFVAHALGAPPPAVTRKGDMAMQGGGGDGAAAAGADSADPLTNQLAGMSKQQLYDLLAQMKVLIQTNRSQARAILVENPQLAKGLFQAQVMLGMVKATSASAPEPGPQPPAASSQQRPQGGPPLPQGPLRPTMVGRR
ncbi:hypothetical protein CLOM_g3415, partial [Closterium sp. NIES-68]